MAAIPLFDHASLTVTDRASLARYTDYTTLDALLQAEPALTVADVIPQDEFANDVLVPLPSGRYLSFEVTCLGEITAVAVWPDRPSAEMLLQARVAHGWKPVVSRLTCGNRILGYAARLFEVHPN